jgi:prepilin-type N-terminal cleavage/methylation domain-containing protein
MICAANRKAFTLTELLVVITIISILLGMLYGAIRTVSRYSRETITRGELANIEAAWKNYYDYYHSWPTNGVGNSNADLEFELDFTMARMLQGFATNGLNQDNVPFLDLTRFEKSDAPAPINAWGANGGQRYSFKLDVDGDNTLTVKDNTASGTNTIFRRVAVWTRNPERPGVIIGSWQQ